METFVTPETIQKSKNKARKMTRLLPAMAAGAMALFTALCLMTRTGNARTTLAAAMILAVLAGWGILAFWLFAAEPARSEARHLEGLSEGEAQVREGRITLDPAGFRIPKSVRVLKVYLETGEETLSLNLNEKLRSRMPPDGSRVRVQTVRKFITGMEVLERAGETAPRQPSGGKGFRRALGKFFPGAVIWTMLAVILTGFVFTRITDTAPSKKITVYADCALKDGAELAGKLEEGMAGAVRMVKVHPFSFALFGTEQLKTADLYIVPDSHAEEYGEWFLDGQAGTVVYDPETGYAAAEAYFVYTPEGGEPEPYRMYIGAGSPHLEDGLAEKAAELLLAVEGKEEP